jgi:von Willebrand factor type A domain
MVVSRISLAAALALALGACGNEEKTSSPCARGELEACGLICSVTTPCAGGTFCGRESSCTAECTAASVAQDCRADEACSSDGRCVGNAGDAGADGAGGGEDAGCGYVTLQTKPVTPNVVLIIDQSSSMDEKFGSSTRWQSLKDSLLSETGLIKELEHVVRFGATFYSAREGGATCPMLTEVQVAVDNYESIKAKYPARTIAETPTGDAIEAVLQKLPSAGVDTQVAPTIFVLATDGEPDRCEQLNPQMGQQEAIDAVKHAHTLGVRTYVIGVAQEVSEAHLQELANAGVGQASGNAPKYRANDDMGLRTALRTIVGGEVTCQVPLKGTVTGGTCAGNIRLNGKPVTCSPSDGYQIVGGNAVQLSGSACESLKRGEVLSAMFQCGDAVPLL